MSRFEERVVLITGAASGIGAATARRFARDGARLSLADRDGDRLERLDITPAAELVTVADTADDAAVDDLVTRTVDRFGKIDVLVANAGIWQERSFLDIAVDEWDTIIRVNLRGSFLMCQRAARAMVDAGVHGAIVATASTNSTVAEVDTAHYNASKGGLLMLVKSMSVDLAPYGIRVNAVAPGTTETALNKEALEHMSESAVAAALPPLKRWGRSEECAAAIAFLASDDAEYITGTTLLVDGGRLALNGLAK